MKSRYRTSLVALTALAAANLCAGVWLSTDAARARDLHAVVEWAGAWIAGANPYAPVDAVVDYPPWALVVLAPLAALPAAWLAPIWVAVNATLLVLLVVRLVRLVGEPTRVRWALALLLGATACARTLSQFSLLSDTLAIFGAFSSSRVFGGLCLGMSLMKPQIGGVALVWCLLQREWARAGVALALAACLTGAFAFRIGLDPFALLDQYAGVLAYVHGAAAPLGGHTELRAWLLALVPSHAVSLSTSAILMVALLLPAIVSVGASARARQKATGDDGLELLALCGAASLLAVRHLSYDFILLWPALLAWRAAPLSVRPAGAGWPPAFALLSALLVLGLPAWVRLAVAGGAPGGLLVVTETDRLAAAGAWLALSWRLLFGTRGRS